MGGIVGHLVAGAFFIFIGTWHWINVLMIYTRDLRKDGQLLRSPTFISTTWFPLPWRKCQKVPVEPLVKIFLTVCGIVLELIHDDSWVLINDEGDFVEGHLNNYSHAAMYSAFLIWAVVEVLQFYKVLALPSFSNHMFAAIAFSIEGLLFYFHLDGRPKLDQLLHIFLYVVVFITAFVLLAEAWMKNSLLLLIARVHLSILQGTWFFQIAHSLHGVNPWKNIKPNQEFVAIAFAWHAVAIMAFTTVSLVIVSGKVRGCRFEGRNVQENIEIQNTGRAHDPESTSLMDEEDNME